MYPSFSGYSSTLSIERNQHIDELLRRFPSTKAINADRSVFDLALDLQGGRTTALRISLSPHFPQDRPTLTVLLPVQHSAVDSTGRVHTPQLSQWAYGASRLGDVVADAVATLSGSAAEVAPRLTAGSYTSQGSSGGSFSAGGSFTAGGSYSGPAPTYSQLGPMSQARLNLMGQTGRASPTGAPTPGVFAPASAAGGPGGQQQQQQQPGRSPSPRRQMAVNSASERAAEEISRMDAALLQELLTDEQAMHKFIVKHLKNCSAAAALEEIRVQNRQLAEANLSRESAIGEAKNQLAIVKSSDYVMVRQQFEELLARQHSVLEQLGPQKLRAELEATIATAESSCDEVEAQFCRKQLPVDGFVTQYMAARCRYHELDLKKQVAERALWNGVQ